MVQQAMEYVTSLTDFNYSTSNGIIIFLNVHNKLIFCYIYIYIYNSKITVYVLIFID